MLSRFRKRFSYANVAMTLALVFAMSGGAYAAKHYLITSTNQISPKVLKALKGKNGANGAAGPSGATGAQGAQGPQGPAAAAGPPGPKGEAGPKGEPGTPGKEGEPWTVNGTLPSGKSEKGTWGFSLVTTTNNAFATAPISFQIPLAAALDTAHVHYVKFEEAEPPAACQGTVEAPTAEKGNLCVYERFTAGLSEEYKPHATNPMSTFFGEAGASPTGAIVFLKPEPETGSFGWGSWAVTAP